MRSEPTEGSGMSDMKNAETGSAGKDGFHDAGFNKEPASVDASKDGFHDAGFNKEPASVDAGQGNTENKSAATVQQEQAAAGDIAERPGNEPLSNIADAASRGGTRELPGGAEVGAARAASNDGQVHGAHGLGARVAALEDAVSRLQRQQKSLGL